MALDVGEMVGIVRRPLNVRGKAAKQAAPIIFKSLVWIPFRTGDEGLSLPKANLLRYTVFCGRRRKVKSVHKQH